MYRDYILDPHGPHGVSAASWIEKGKTALLIVDLQNYMTRRDFSSRWSADGKDDYYFNRFEQTVLPNLQRLIGRFHILTAPVIYLRIAYYNRNAADVPSGLARKRLEEDLHFCRGEKYTLHEHDPASQIDERIAPQPEDIVINKTCSGAFCSSNLDSVLRSNNISCLVFTGGLTEACVESTLREAFDRGYWCTVVDDACVTSTPEAHHASLRSIGEFFGWVTATDELLNRLQKPKQ